ncbi:juvenile hormone acid O-methyltransferase isoform X1 [Rhipicephalus sanguineus]|uniref:juvenile hormone acid O-methyltransferase isoform X1 n=1 Tax=Rhipicephalus sanguineus TaxID=34632 RepID=UPI001892DEA5|nr:juvenile hormone acid O-methyltransferase isoform X1 [Rhipicephalus sanguineus]
MATHRKPVAAATLPFTQSNVPKVYDEVRGPDRQATAELLQAWQASFFTCSNRSDASDHQYLDVGCGPGNLTRNHLLPSCPPTLKRLLACDNSPAMVDYARTVHGHPKIDHRLLDIAVDEDVQRFIAEEGRFQRVYSFLVFHWIQDRAVALKNIERLMTPGGECLIIYNPQPGPAMLNRAFLESESWAKYRDVMSMPIFHECGDAVSLRKSLFDLVKQTGLVPLSCELVRINVKSANVDDAARLFTVGAPFYHLLTEEEKPDLLKFVRNFMLQGRCSNFSTTGTTEQLRFVFHGYKP